VFAEKEEAIIFENCQKSIQSINDKGVFRHVTHFRPETWLVTLLTFFLALASCSRRIVPSASTPALPATSPVVADREMDEFIRGGTGKYLDTRHVKPDQVIGTAEKFLGTPHCMGGSTSRCMDCSGLTYTAFAKHRVVIPRSSQDQARYGVMIMERQALKRGDLLFFTRSYNSSDYITHVGIYLGNNQFIHTSTSQGVTITPLDNPWWSQRYLFGTRVF